MAKREKYCVFKLDKRHTPTDERRSGTNRGVSIPAKDIILDSDGKERLIAYVPQNGQKSIYVDMWKNYKGEQDIRKISAPKITFTDKVKILDPERNSLLIEFLRVTNANGSNENRDHTKVALFYEEKALENTEKSYDQEILVNKAERFIIEARYENLVAVAGLLDIPTEDANNVDLTEVELKMALMSEAKRRPSEVMDIIQDPRIEQRITINRAFKLNYIKFDKSSGQILWTDTKTPVMTRKVRRGVLPLDHVLNYCSENGGDGKEVYQEILYAVEGENAVELETSDASVVDNFTNDELYTAAKDAGILIPKGAFVYVDDANNKNNMIPNKGKKGVIKLMDENAEFNGYNLKEYLVRSVKDAIYKKL